MSLQKQQSDLTAAEKISEGIPENDEFTQAPKLTLDRMMTFTLAGRGSVEETLTRRTK